MPTLVTIMVQHYIDYLFDVSLNTIDCVKRTSLEMSFGEFTITSLNGSTTMVSFTEDQSKEKLHQR